MQSHQMKRAAGNSAPTDSDFKQVTLLLHGDGTNGGQNNTFIDGSTNNFTITRNGNVAQGTFSPYSQPDGRWSNYFDGTDDYLSIADNTALQPGTSTFTLEAWVYRGASGAAHTIYAKGGASTGFVFQVTSTNVLRFTDTTTNIDSTGTISANQWVHVAAVREGTGTNQLKLYINGVSDGTGTSATNFNQTEQARIGTDRSAAADFNGYISNLRFVKGSTVYTGAFTPPTSPLTAITNTSLLTCQSNRFIDNSSNAFAITKNGDAATTAFSPFAPTAAYVSSVNGGSGYFDGNADKISAASNAAFVMGSGDFTVEAWCYQTGKTDPYPRLIHFGPFWSSNDAWGACPRDNDYPTKITFISYKLGGRVLISSSDFKLNAWNHVVVTRASGVFRLFVNGILEATNSSFVGTSIESSSTNSVCVGSAIDNSNEEDFAGYITDVRVVKGSVVSAYSTSSTTIGASIFTPPTSPVTAVTSTNLLLNCTNGAVVDNAAKNDIETVSNAQVSTAQAKFGTGSLYFDGTDDGIFIRNTPELRFGTGDFTIEAWIYLSTTGAFQAIVEARPSDNSSQFGIYIDSSNKPYWYDGTSRTSSIALSGSTWTHVAFVRTSGVLKIYVGGTEGYSASFTSDVSPTATYAIGRRAFDSSNEFNGYLDDIRITKGVARYTAAFTPPTRAFPDK